MGIVVAPEDRRTKKPVALDKWLIRSVFEVLVNLELRHQLPHHDVRHNLFKRYNLGIMQCLIRGFIFVLR